MHFFYSDYYLLRSTDAAMLVHKWGYHLQVMYIHLCLEYVPSCLFQGYYALFIRPREKGLSYVF